MPSPFLVRHALDSDREEIYRLYENLFRADIERLWGWDEAWQVDNFAKEWDASLTEVIEVDGSHAGYLQRLFKEDHVYLLSLGLAEEWQGRGIGTAILKDLLSDAAERGLPLRLSVFRTEARRLKFYETLGFHITATEESFWRLEWRDGEFLGAPENRG